MLNGNCTIVEEIYDCFFPKIKQFILANSGSEEDAKDTFQEGLLAVYHNALQPNFQLTCQFETYLQAIVRNIWNKQLRVRNNKQVAMSQYQPIFNYDLEEDTSVIANERHQLYLKHFRTLSENAQTFLSLYLQGLDMKSIAKELGLASEAYARKRKFQCKEMLAKRVRGDVNFQRLIER